MGTVELLAPPLIIAWLMRLGRTDPQLDASLLFERDAWSAAYVLNEVVRLLAMCGELLGRKGDAEPGAKIL